MIIVVDSDHDVDALHQTLRRGGYILRSKPGGIFELLRVNAGRPLCDKCHTPAATHERNESLCVKHWKESHERLDQS